MAAAVGLICHGHGEAGCSRIGYGGFQVVTGPQNQDPIRRQ